MPFARSSSQGWATLEEFYGELAASGDESTAQLGRAMLELLPGLHTSFSTRSAWGLTSHYQLWLLPADDPRSPWLVEVIGFPGEYTIGFRMPETEAPWPNAMVRGTARTLAEALHMLEIAITRSKGWASE